MVKRSRGVAGRMEKGVQFLMKKNKITVIEGEARLEKGSAAPKVIVKAKDGKDATYDAKHVILATGARAREIPAAGLKADGKRIWTYRDAMTPPAWPEIAAGVRLRRHRHRVRQLLRGVRREGDGGRIARSHPAGRGRRDLRVRQEALREGGHEILTSTEAKSLKATANGVEARRLSSGKERNADRLTRHRRGRHHRQYREFGLEALGVKIEKGHIVTDGYGKTNVAGLYAIGDVTGAPWLAHKASHEGIICIEAIAGQKPHAMIKERIPGCTYSHPQVASVGLTEAKAKARAGR